MISLMKIPAADEREERGQLTINNGKWDRTPTLHPPFTPKPGTASDSDGIAKD
jgi:hypothetical protein